MSVTTFAQTEISVNDMTSKLMGSIPMKEFSSISKADVKSELNKKGLKIKENKPNKMTQYHQIALSGLPFIYKEFPVTCGSYWSKEGNLLEFFSMVDTKTMEDALKLEGMLLSDLKASGYQMEKINYKDSRAGLKTTLDNAALIAGSIANIGVANAYRTVIDNKICEVFVVVGKLLGKTHGSVGVSVYPQD